MDVVLDSNVYIGDFLLKAKNFDALLDYLKRTDSSVVMPQVIMDEVSEKYFRQLTDNIEGID